MSKLFIKLIKYYQSLSRSVLQTGQLPFLMYSGCKFQPTCSDYAIGALTKHGIVVGLGKSVIRIIKCNPLSKGGIDNL